MSVKSVKWHADISFAGHQNTLRVLYCQSKPTAPKVKSVRYIPQAEDRILDAPELLNDFCKCSLSLYTFYLVEFSFLGFYGLKKLT